MAHPPLSCPLCSNESAFSNLECFQVSLLLVSSKRLLCPVCQDVVFGLDKLTIHLFQHQAFGKVLPHHLGLSDNAVESDMQQADQQCMLLPDAESLDHQETERVVLPLSESLPIETEESFSPVNLPDNLIQQLNEKDEQRTETPVESSDVQNDTNYTDIETGIIMKNDFIDNSASCSVEHQSIDLPETTKSEELLTHEVSASDLDNPWHCPCCETGSPPIRSSQTEPTCDVCLVSFNCIQFWNQHLLAVHKTNYQKDISEDLADDCFDCKMCMAPCVDLPSLHSHMNNVHDDRPFLCHICYKSFKVKGSLRVHVRVVHGIHNKKKSNKEKTNPTSPTESQNTKVDEGASTSARSPSKQWECELCKKLFSTKYFLKKHKRLHTGETPYCCEVCGRTFTFQQSYHKHMLYHSDDRPHTCLECGKSFKEISTLNNHQRIHTGERPYGCENCGKSFRQRVSYLVHRRIHTGVMPYECKECGKSFRYKVSLRSHKCSQFYLTRRENEVTPETTVEEQNTINENNFINSTSQTPWTTTSTELTSTMFSEIDDIINSMMPQQQCDLVNDLETINRDSVKELLFNNL